MASSDYIINEFQCSLQKISLSEVDAWCKISQKHFKTSKFFELIDQTLLSLQQTAHYDFGSSSKDDCIESTICEPDWWLM